MVADALMNHPGVNDVLVVPIDDPGGPVIGAAVEGAVDAAELRAAAARALPPWLQPHVLVVLPALPRLPGGKPDRRACQARLIEARSPRSASPTP
jgi:O-succinylbenzoic acid--CoA ligase